MDAYFIGTDNVEALRWKDGPEAAPSGGFDFVETKGIFPSPHLELLVTSATGEAIPTLVSKLVQIWPEPVTNPADYVPGDSINLVPPVLVDKLAAIEVDDNVAARWAPEMWGFSEKDALTFGKVLAGIARRAKEQGKPLYWFAEM